MKGRTGLIAIGVVALGAAGYALLGSAPDEPAGGGSLSEGDSPRAAASDRARPTRDRTTPDARPGVAPTAAQGEVKQQEALPDSPEHIAVRDAVLELHTINSGGGRLTYDEAKALLAQRAERTKAVRDNLVKLGAAGADAIRSEYPRVEGTKAKLVLVDALAEMEDGDSAQAMLNLYESDTGFSRREAMVKGLGRRTDDAAHDALGDMFEKTDDKRIKMAVIMALGRNKAGFNLISNAASNDSEPEVQITAIRALTNFVEGKSVLEQLMTSLPPATRVHAQRAITRAERKRPAPPPE